MDKQITIARIKTAASLAKEVQLILEDIKDLFSGNDLFEDLCNKIQNCELTEKEVITQFENCCCFLAKSDEIRIIKGEKNE